MILTPNLDYDGSEPIYMQLYRYIVGEIGEMRLEAMEKLPSVRQLAKYLGISRNSVESAYNQLLAEGYITSVERKGYFIAAISRNFESTKLLLEKEDLEMLDKLDLKDQTFDYDFKSDYISKENFDYRLWKKHLNYILNYQSDLLYGYGDVRGEVVLRERIAEHFYRTRGIRARMGNIIIGGGVSPLLAILTKLFNYMEVDGVGMEDPGYNKVRSIFEYSHMKVSPIPVGTGGIDVEALFASDARVCYVSPSHQFPTGLIMPVGNRAALLDWSIQVDGYIIEDDYNAQLRFEGKPIPAMQGMDCNDKVIYLGSFSTVLAPAIRVSFMVLPTPLNDLYNAYIDLFSQSASKLEQLALAELIRSGDFEKHIKRIRKNYSRKQEYVVKCLKKYMPSYVKLKYGKSGLQVTLDLPQNINALDVVEKCREQKVLVDLTSHYCYKKNQRHLNQLIISYRGIDENLIDRGILIISKVILQLA